ncbi:MAG: transglutaminase family protein [Deltaproteobacteria bacterium]|nr:transglutaminase family protein [Deltaproteobacteria bacterium]MBW2447886.1 transglutaminase family protein [Deltaproteobacteria bacterium]
MIDSTLSPTPFLDFDRDDVARFAREHAGSRGSPLERAVRLYYAVRDGIRYDPYGAGVSVEGIRASNTLAAGRGWCVSKSVLLGAACRAEGIPARLGFADVRNHLSTENMRAIMKTDVFYWHGYTSIELEGRWVKATPAFNVELCDKFGLLPLEFDGRSDSLYHPFDHEGQRHMEYLNDRGSFDDVPIEAMQATFAEHYPGLSGVGRPGDFDAEVEAETSGPGGAR